MSDMKSGNISMKAILIPFLSLLIPLTPKSAFAQSEPELKLESVVIVSRHGVRAPTKATQLMQDVTPDAWPTWPVKLGWLTPRGGELIAYLGHYPLQCCLSPDTILIWQISAAHWSSTGRFQVSRITRRQGVNWCLNAGVGSAITASGFRFRWSSRLYSRCVIKRRCH